MFGWKTKEKLDIAEKVIGRDKRFAQQYDDAKKIHHLEKYLAAFIMLLILILLIFVK